MHRKRHLSKFGSSTHLFSALVIFSLLFSVLSMFPPPAADAQNDEGVSPTPVVETQDGATPTQTAESQNGVNAQLTEDTVDLGGGVLAQDKQDPPVSVVARSLLCPPGNPLEDLSRDNLSLQCTIPGTGIPFTVTSSGGEPRSIPTDAAGQLALSDLPPGKITLSQTLMNGYELTAVYCHPTPPPEFADVFIWELFPINNGTLGYNLLSGYSLNCEFYNSPVGTAQESETGELAATPVSVRDETNTTGSIVVHKYLCPSSVLHEPAANLQTYRDGCPTPHYGVTVSVRSGANVLASEMVAYDGDGTVSFPAIDRGSVDLANNGGSDLSRTYCRTYPRSEDNGEGASYSESTVVLDIQAGIETECYWFTFPEAPDDTYSTITVDLNRCGPSYPQDSATSTVQDWLGACPDSLPGVAFYALDADVTVEVGTTGQDGIITLHGKPGELAVAERVPAEFQTGYAYCEIRDANQAPVYDNGGYIASGETGVPFLNDAERHDYYCYWFNVLSDGNGKTSSGSGNVVVTKWRCPEYYDATRASLEKLLEDCTAPHSGIRIDISYPSGESFTQQTASGKGGPAIARFEGIPAGKAGIGESAPQGHSLKRAFCSTGEISQPALTGMSGYVEQTVADNGFVTTIEAGKEISCYLFNVPVGEGTPPEAGMVTIDTRICPPGFAANDPTQSDIALYCVAEGGVEFNASNGETTRSATTYVTGIVEISGVPAGTVRITELPREGYDPPQVFCRSTAVGEGTTGELMPVTVDNWGITFELPEGHYLQCVWANLPAAGNSTDPGTVILHAFTCPEGTGEYGALETLQASCTERTAGLKFTAGQPLSTPVEGETDAGGDVTFSSLTPGFNVVEIPDRQGYAALTSWCDYYGSANGSADGYGRHTTRPQYAYLAGGYTLECYWFNVPYIEPITVITVMRVCPSDFDLLDATSDKIAANCPNGPEGIPFRVTNTSGLQSAPVDDVYEANQATDVSGALFFDQVSIAKFAMAELSPRYETVRVICGHTVTVDPPSSYLTLGIANDEVSYQAEPGAIVTCTWATQEIPPFEMGVNVRHCLPYYEFASSDLEYLKTNCPARPDADFRIATDDGTYDKSATTNVAGLAVFEQVPPGVLVMTEPSPELRVVRAFCGTQDSGPVSLEFSTDTAEYIATSGKTVTCDWFTIDNTRARASVSNTACPEDYDPRNRPYEELLQDCATTLTNVRFDLGGTNTTVSATSSEGIARFDALTPGTVILTQTPPEGYSGAVVYCRTIDPALPRPPYTLASVENYSVEGEVAGGNELECAWFSYDSPYGSVTIHKYGCELGFIPTSDAREEDLEACATPLEGVEFSLGGPAAGISRDTDATGTVTWEDLQPGPVYITESPPEDYTNALVLCRVDRGNSAAVPVEEFTIELPIEKGSAWECLWLNYEERVDAPTPATPTPNSGNGGGGGGGNGGSGGGGSVSGGSGSGGSGSQFSGSDAPATLILNTFVCPAGFDVHGPDSQPTQDCTEPATDIAFSLGIPGDDGEGETATAKEGRVEFAGVADGPYLLAGELPDQTRSAFVFTCRSDQREFQTENPFVPFAYAGPAGQIGVVLVAGETLECDWFNVPEPEVTLLAFQCASAPVNIAECQPANDPATLRLELIGGDSEPVELTTDESGKASLSLAQGEYSLIDLPPTVCMVDSASFDADGVLVVGEKPVEVRLYHCGRT